MTSNAARTALGTLRQLEPRVNCSGRGRQAVPSESVRFRPEPDIGMPELSCTAQQRRLGRTVRRQAGIRKHRMLPPGLRCRRLCAQDGTARTQADP